MTTVKSKVNSIWTAEIDETIIKSIESGKSLMEISDGLSLPNDKILKRFRRLINKSDNKGKKSNEIIKAYKIKDKKIMEYVKKYYK